MKQRVLVCGGRSYADIDSLNKVLDAAHYANPIECLIHGDAPGADTLAKEWARNSGVFCQAYRANWKELGKSAGPIRNRRMLEDGKPHMVIAFPGGVGTADMIRRAEEAKVPVVRITAALVRRMPELPSQDGA